MSRAEGFETVASLRVDLGEPTGLGRARNLTAKASKINIVVNGCRKLDNNTLNVYYAARKQDTNCASGPFVFRSYS